MLNQITSKKSLSRIPSKPSSIAYALACVLPFLWGTAFAQNVSIISGDKNSSTRLANNKATIFDIANPNQSGLSYNRLTTFNVTANGAVVNNAIVTTKTGVAGDVTANQNLTMSAKTILADVSGGSGRSTLAGTLELTGPTAGLIIANPYGISCSSCSFVNFGGSDVTLVAGKPIVDSKDASIRYGDITNDISVTSLKSDSRATNLIANSVISNGATNVIGALNIEAYAADAQGIRRATGGSITLSSGSMYASRISISAPTTAAAIVINQNLSSSEGIYVNNAAAINANSAIAVTKGDINLISGGAITAVGEMTANSGDILLESGKNIQINAASALSANNPLRATSVGDLGVGNIILKSGTGIDVGKTRVLAANNIAFSAKTGDLTFNSSVVSAGNNIDLNAEVGSIASVASLGTGLSTTNKPLQTTISEQLIYVFKLKLGEKFEFDTKEGTLGSTSLNAFKAGTELSETMKQLGNAVGGNKSNPFSINSGGFSDLSFQSGGSTDIGLKWIQTIKTSSSSDQEQNIDRTTFTAGGNLSRKAGDGIRDQATRISVGGNFTETANNIAASAFNVNYSADSFNGKDTNNLAGGLVFRGWLPGLYLQYNKDVIGTNTHSTGMRELGINYAVGGNYSSIALGDASYKVSSIATLGDTNFLARNLAFQSLKYDETSNGIINGWGLQLRGEVGFFGANGSGRLYGTLGSSLGTASGARPGVLSALGNFTAASSVNSVYEGSLITVGGDTLLKADKTLDFKAIDSNMRIGTQALTIGAFGGAGVNWGGLDFWMGMDAKYAGQTDTLKTQVAGNISGKGNIGLRSGNGMMLNGTNLAARTGSVNIDSGGDFSHYALTNSARTDAGTGIVLGQIRFGIGWTGIPNFGFDVAGQVSLSAANNVNKATGSITAGKDVSVKSIGNVTLEGTDLLAGYTPASAATATKPVTSEVVSATGSAVSLNVGKSLNFQSAASNANTGQGTVGAQFGIKVGSELGFSTKFYGAVQGKTASTEKRGTVKADNIAIVVGSDASFAGTYVRAKNNLNIDVANNLTMTSAVKKYNEAKLSAGFGLGLSVGLGATPSFMPEFSISLEAQGRSLNVNYDSTLAAENLKLNVGKNTLLSGGTIESPHLTQKLGGTLTVKDLNDWAIGAGFTFDFGQKFGQKISTTWGLTPSISFQYNPYPNEAEVWTRVGGGIGIDSPTGTNIGISGYIVGPAKPLQPP